MKKLLFIFACLFSFSAFAQAPAPHFADHNGSIVQIDSLPNNGVLIRYSQVRPSLAGLIPVGSTLVQGTWVNGVLQATAFTFSRCGPIPYNVSGTVNQVGVLILQGPAPLIDAWSCQVIDWIWSDNSRLVFAPLASPNGS